MGFKNDVQIEIQAPEPISVLSCPPQNLTTRPNAPNPIDKMHPTSPNPNQRCNANDITNFQASKISAIKTVFGIH